MSELNSRIMLNEIIFNCIAIPSLASRVERAIIDLDFRFTLEKLKRKSLRGMPSNVTMHEPGLDDSVRIL